MIKHWGQSLAWLALILPGLASALDTEDFTADTTEELIALCAANPKDTDYAKAIHFCHGYLVGAYDYYQAVNNGPEGKKLVCFPDPRPSRNKAIEEFVVWVGKHPEYNKELPVETEFRFLMEKWPCNAQ